MADILLDAHGTWDPSSVPAYTIVPKGSTLKYFTENMRLFGDSEMRRGQMLTSEPSQEVGAQKQCQNYTVSPAPETAGFLVPSGMTRKTPGGNMLLCTSDQCAQDGWHNPANCQGLFAEADYENANIYFAVCRHISLNPTGGIPELNTQQADVGAAEGEVPDSTLDDMLDKYLPGHADYAILDAGERDTYKNLLRTAWGDNDVSRRLIGRLDARY
jgi:hypothetical protein